MKQKIKSIIPLLFFIFIASCNNKETSQNYKLTESEKRMCDTLQIDSTIIQDIRQVCANKFEPFHYSLSKSYKDGVESELDPIYLKGLVCSEHNSKSYNLIFSLKDNLHKKGYTIFLLENNFNINGKLDNIGILKTTNQYSVLKQIGTDGINYDITNDSLIKIIKQFDKKYSLELVGASGDWCEFVINKEPQDWKEFANEVYKVCPDVVEQGTETEEALANEMKKSKRLYFWWD
jgi:Domain of unknown function (DUF4253)